MQSERPLNDSAPKAAVPSNNAWAAGHRLAAFELQAVVSCRAAGVVYRAWDHALDMQVAVKEYLPARLATRADDGSVVAADAADPLLAGLFDRGLQAFVAEARTLARCDHPALVRVLHLLQAHGTAYRVMPWVAGRSLLDLRQEMAAPPDEAALRRLLDGLLGALDAYHRAGGVHGNVGPSQILLRGDDGPVLLGPGAAGRATASDAVETLMRQLEPAFAAPEQKPADGTDAPAEAGESGPWTDLYALAGVLRFCITGALPPPAGGPAPEPLAAAAARAVAAAGMPPYSLQLLAALDAAAAPLPTRRPQSVAAMRALMAQTVPVAAPAPAGASTEEADGPGAPARSVAAAVEAAQNGVRAAAVDAARDDTRSAAVAGAQDGTFAAADRSARVQALAPDSAETPAQPAPPKGPPAGAGASGAAAPADGEAQTLSLIQRAIASVTDGLPPRPAGLAPHQRTEGSIEPPFDDAASGAAWPPDPPAPLAPSASSTPLGPLAPQAPEPAQPAWPPAVPPAFDEPPRRATAPRRQRPALWLAAALPLLALLAFAGWQAARPTAGALPVAAAGDTAAPAGNGAAAAPVSPLTGPSVPAVAGRPAAPDEASGMATALAGRTDANAGAGPPPALAAAPAAPAAAPPVPPATSARRAPRPSSPRAECGKRSDAALARCLQQQCKRSQWSRHPQCAAVKRASAQQAGPAAAARQRPVQAPRPPASSAQRRPR